METKCKDKIKCFIESIESYSFYCKKYDRLELIQFEKITSLQELYQKKELSLEPVLPDFGLEYFLCFKLHHKNNDFRDYILYEDIESYGLDKCFLEYLTIKNRSFKNEIYIDLEVFSDFLLNKYW